MNPTFFKPIFNIADSGVLPKTPEVIQPPAEINTYEGGEFIDDKIRMKEELFIHPRYEINAIRQIL